MTDTPSQDPRPNTCRFIAADPRDPGWSFCGKPTEPGSSWCPEHAAIVFISNSSLTTKRRKRLAKGTQS